MKMIGFECNLKPEAYLFITETLKIWNLISDY